MTQAQQSASFFLGRGSRSFMEAQWIVDGPLDPVRGKVRSFLAARRMTIVEDGTAEVVATEGSQVRTRAIGGWFVNPESLPKRAAIHLTSSGQNVIVDAIVFETLGFGILDPHFDGRYQRYFGLWIDALKALIPERLARPTGFFEELELLADLRDRGVLTEDEFLTRKSKILGP